jgi:glycosyltransferase involved in cell wall biosynthesis
MHDSLPLVSIGIPTYNREKLLGRSIESALNQDYPNIEVVISDNASTDATQSVCAAYCLQDPRVTYERLPRNLGATANFSAVLARARGDFFVWLGDDDWMDEGYVRRCVQELMDDPTLALVAGTAHYYRSGQHVNQGRVLNLLQAQWWRRIASYYMNVTDNGIFYGVMRRAQIQAAGFRNVMAGDWLVMANVLSFGKAKTLEGVSVHRELGGASSSPRAIVKSLGLTGFQAWFPKTAVATNACLDIVGAGNAHRDKPIAKRMVLAAYVFSTVLTRYAALYATAAVQRTRNLLFRPDGSNGRSRQPS